MKTTLRALAAFFATLTIFFLAFAFVKADINPFNWSQSLRLVFVYLALVLGSMVTMLVHALSDDN